MASEEAGKPYSGPVDFKKEYDVSHVKGKTAIVTGGASGLGVLLKSHCDLSPIMKEKTY